MNSTRSLSPFGDSPAAASWCAPAVRALLALARELLRMLKPLPAALSKVLLKPYVYEVLPVVGICRESLYILVSPLCSWGLEDRLSQLASSG